jgi:hypothetical protein
MYHWSIADAGPPGSAEVSVVAPGPESSGKLAGRTSTAVDSFFPLLSGE